MLSGSAIGRALVLPTVVLVVTFALYARTLDDYWIKDDLLIGNFTTDGRLDWGFMAHYAWPTAMQANQFWRPVPMLLGFLDYEIWGPDPFGFHLTNTLLAALVAILLARAVNVLAGSASRAPGLLAALLLLTCPSTPEAVVWTLQRMVLICAAFSLVAILAWLRAARGGGRGARIVGTGALVLAILSKEIAVVLPGCLVLIDLLHPPGAPWRARLRRALGGAAVCALVLAVYFGFRWVLWGRFDLAYAGLSPAEYASANRVFERMGESLANVLLPVNAALFGETTRALLRGAMLSGWALAAVRGAALATRHDGFRRSSAIWAAMAVLFFLPTLWIFWVTPDLFNARLFYQSALALAALGGGALALAWPGGREPALLRACRLLGAGLLVVAFSIAIGRGLSAFEMASEQVEGIQTAIEEVAEDHERAHGRRPVVVALNTPAMVAGVPTLEDSLERALLPPLSTPGVRTIPLVVTTAARGAAWHDAVARRVASEGLAWSDLVYVWCEFAPPGVTPVFPPLGAEEGVAARTIEPPDGLALRNDRDAPTFVFAPPAGRDAALEIAIDRGPTLRVPVEEGHNAVRAADGVVRMDLDRGARGVPELAGIWQRSVRRPLPHPLAMTWRVLTLDEAGAVIGRGAARRLIVLDVLGGG